jgi:hypothetical protein
MRTSILSGPASSRQGTPARATKPLQQWFVEYYAWRCPLLCRSMGKPLHYAWNGIAFVYSIQRGSGFAPLLLNLCPLWVAGKKKHFY